MCSIGAFVDGYCEIKRISESFQPKIDRFVSIVSAMNSENRLIPNGEYPSPLFRMIPFNFWIACFSHNHGSKLFLY